MPKKEKLPPYANANYFHGVILKPGDDFTTPFFSIPREQIYRDVMAIPLEDRCNETPCCRWEAEDKPQVWDEDYGENDLLFRPFSPACTMTASPPDDDNGGVDGMDDPKAELKEVQGVEEVMVEVGVDVQDDDDWVVVSSDGEA